jgi:hypothetical protein
MTKEIAILAVHGMGKTEKDFDRELKNNIRDRLGPAKWSAISWHPVYYQAVLQGHQARLMRSMKSSADIDGIRLRQFLLYSFSDAASMEARPEEPGSAYELIQETILDALIGAHEAIGDPKAPVVVIAHSLGCQVISNYIWDAQTTSASAGIFREDYDEPVGKTSPEDKFYRLKSLRFLFTSGCNIPVFIAGRPKDKIKPVKVASSGWSFRWENYYDPDDVLGWPLHPINSAYKSAVHVDKSVNVGGFFTNWNPASHNEYWDDNDFLRPVEDGIRSLLID